MKPFHSIALAALLALPVTAVAQESQGYAPTAEAKGDIIETATAAGSFTTLAQAIEAAGLVETLKGEGRSPCSRRPTRRSRSCPKARSTALLTGQGEAHRDPDVPRGAGKVSSEDVAQLPMARTVNGQDLKITAADGKVMVGNATVTQADIPASNGVIHVIDNVLLPE